MNSRLRACGHEVRLRGHPLGRDGYRMVNCCVAPQRPSPCPLPRGEDRGVNMGNEKHRPIAGAISARRLRQRATLSWRAMTFAIHHPAWATILSPWERVGRGLFPRHQRALSTTHARPRGCPRRRTSWRHALRRELFAGPNRWPSCHRPPTATPSPPRSAPPQLYCAH